MSERRAGVRPGPAWPGSDWDWAEAAVRRSIRASVRRELAGVYLHGPLPPGGAVVAPTHGSWWDGYLLRELAWTVGHPARVMMLPGQLVRFPFLRRVGAIGAGDLRAAVRAARAGEWMVIFPEGRVSAQLAALRPGAAWVAGVAGVPLVPVALRVVMRGAQHPEAFLRFGPPTTGEALRPALEALLAALDADLRAADPEAPPDGYLRVVRGQGSTHDRVGVAARLLTLLTERR
ncbi:1-acyl-sn-glycerol-3-phosphate acyltransferase [uncultured Deinococcus sp.]|uniref:1-acyl-sn-glycerol-3-phosphate acyltransferase n=1 Tax=uncultured Deinococcus sp. TaxID=158789 RepID=UPI0033905D3E